MSTNESERDLYASLHHIHLNSEPEVKLKALRLEMITQLSSLRGYSQLLLRLIDEPFAEEARERMRLYLKQLLLASDRTRDILDAVTGYDQSTSSIEDNVPDT